MGYVRGPATISCRRENPGCREFCVGGAGRSARRRQGTVRQSYPLLRWYLSPTSRLRRLSIIAWRAGAVNRDRATRLDRVRLFDRPLCSGKRGNQHRRDARYRIIRTATSRRNRPTGRARWKCGSGRSLAGTTEPIIPEARRSAAPACTIQVPAPPGGACRGAAGAPYLARHSAMANVALRLSTGGEGIRTHKRGRVALGRQRRFPYGRVRVVESRRRHPGLGNKNGRA
jgi:hypothetical protein